MSDVSVTTRVARVSFRLTALVLAVLTGFALFLIIPARSSRATTPAPLFAITPTAFDFGDVPLNNSSAEQLVTVENISSTSQIINATGGYAGVFGGTQDCQGETLAVGQTCHLYYQFTPTALGPQTATATGVLNGQSYSIGFKGNGINQFLITPTALDFGDVGTNTTSAAQTVTITNVGSSALSSVNLVTEHDTAAFPESNNCGLLAAGASCAITYQFAPTAGGEQTASVTGTFNGQPFSVNLAGNGITAQSTQTFLVTPTSFDFGDVPLNNTSPQQLVTVTNVSSTSQFINATGGAAGVFGGTQDCSGVTLAPGASCHLYYQFTPTALGPQTVTATPGFNGDSFTLNLTGTGINQFLISPTGFDFGNGQVGKISAPQYAAVTNVGSASAVFNLVGGVTTNFGGSSDCQGEMIASGATCDLAYEFEPTATGPDTASTTGTVSGQPFSFTFAGNGLPGPSTGPTVTAVYPSSGPTSGGTYVTIIGTGFTGATRVRFGSVSAKFALKSSTKIVALSPAQSAGTRDITVKTAAGTSATVSADKFTYRPVPKVTSVAPSSGPKAGGTFVVITGTGFTGTTTVRFGSVAAKFVVLSSTKIIARSPAESAGTRDVRVTTSGGVSAAVTNDKFTYQ